MAKGREERIDSEMRQMVPPALLVIVIVEANFELSIFQHVTIVV